MENDTFYLDEDILCNPARSKAVKTVTYVLNYNKLHFYYFEFYFYSKELFQCSVFNLWPGAVRNDSQENSNLL